MKKLCQVSGKHTVGGIVFYKHLFLVDFKARLVSDIVRNPICWFSHAKAELTIDLVNAVKKQ